MPRAWILRFGVVLAIVAPAAASAQGRRCSSVQPADSRQLVNAAGHEIVYFQDPVQLRCTGQVHLEADSAVLNRTTSALELIGNVVYRDSATELTADWSNYLGGEDRLASRGNVILTDLVRGSRVTGDQLDYQRATESRPESRMVVQGVGSHAVIREDPRGPEPTRSPPVPPDRERADSLVGDPIGPDPPLESRDPAVPLEVWGDRLEFVGETVFTAQNNVELERGGMTGGGDFARYDQTVEELELVGAAHVEDDRYRLQGERIHAFLSGEVLREVTSEREAELTSADLIVRSDRLRIGFVDGQIDRLEAWNPEPETAPRRARAIAEEFDLRADSIDARTDSGVVREVRAVGRAYGERNADSLETGVPTVVAHDWIQGDTIIGYFAADTTGSDEPDPGPLARTDTSALTPAAQDPGSGPPSEAAGPADSAAVVLERVVVIGGDQPALSLYRMQAENADDGRSINFMRASQIILILSEGEVSRVEAIGPIDGLYLDPVTGQPVPAQDTVPPGNGAIGR